MRFQVARANSRWLFVSENNERREREDGPCGDCFASGRDGLYEVVFEDRGAAQDSQNRHRDDGGWNARGDRQAGVEAQVGICGAEDEGECNSESDAADG